jgi:hypothetical protein
MFSMYHVYAVKLFGEPSWTIERGESLDSQKLHMGTLTNLPPSSAVTRLIIPHQNVDSSKASAEKYLSMHSSVAGFVPFWIIWLTNMNFIIYFICTITHSLFRSSNLSGAGKIQNLHGLAAESAGCWEAKCICPVARRLTTTPRPVRNKRPSILLPRMCACSIGAEARRLSCVLVHAKIKRKRKGDS